MIKKEVENKIVQVCNEKGLSVLNWSDDTDLKFNVDYDQPFEFDIKIHYSTLKSKRGFYLNIPALNLYSNENKVNDLIKTINKANNIIDQLNEFVKEYYNR